MIIMCTLRHKKKYNNNEITAYFKRRDKMTRKKVRDDPDEKNGTSRPGRDDGSSTSHEYVS